MDCFGEASAIWLGITRLRGENGLRFLPRTVPTTTTHPILKHNHMKWPSEVAYSPRVIEVGYEALFSYDFYRIAAIAE